MSSSNSSSTTAMDSNTKLILTAGIAAATGAMLTYTMLSKKIESDKTQKQSEQDGDEYALSKKPSLIFEPPSEKVIFPHNHEEKMRRRIAARVGIEDDNSVPRNKVTVRVPATSANMGPGCTYEYNTYCMSMDHYCIGPLLETVYMYLDSSLWYLLILIFFHKLKKTFFRLFPNQKYTIMNNSYNERMNNNTNANNPTDDCLGMAVDLWSEITVERAEKFEIIASGDGADQMPLDETNLMVIGAKAAFGAAAKTMPPLKYTVVNNIPYARGLGSSSAAIVAGTIAGLILAGHTLPCWGSESLLQIAASIEGHPDNVAPVIYGGIQMGIHNGTRWETERVPVPPGMQLVMFIPDSIGKTSTARGVLGPSVTREEAAFNIGRVAWLVHAMCSGNLDNLRSGVEDKLHQPQRGEHLYPFLYPMIRAAEKAGAVCVYLSGAGPTVMALTSGASGDIFTQRENERTDLDVAKAMTEVSEQFGVTGNVLVTQASHEGARVVNVDPPFSTGNISYRGV